MVVFSGRRDRWPAARLARQACLIGRRWGGRGAEPKREKKGQKEKMAPGVRASPYEKAGIWTRKSKLIPRKTQAFSKPFQGFSKRFPRNQRISKEWTARRGPHDDPARANCTLRTCIVERLARQRSAPRIPIGRLRLRAVDDHELVGEHAIARRSIRRPAIAP